MTDFFLDFCVSREFSLIKPIAFDLHLGNRSRLFVGALFYHTATLLCRRLLFLYHHYLNSGKVALIGFNKSVLAMSDGSRFMVSPMVF